LINPVEDGTAQTRASSIAAQSRRPVVVRQSQLPSRSPCGRLDSESERPTVTGNPVLTVDAQLRLAVNR
jgi:hypothetical protein